MVKMSLNKLLVLSILGLAVACFAHPTVAAARDTQYSPRIAPIQSSPQGQTYGRWAAEWWQWAIGIPAAKNPLTDETGENCAERQVGSVWFLAGSTSPSSFERTCQVPFGKSLFFPLINNAYFAFLNDTPETRTTKYVRSVGSCTLPAQISVKIDNVEINNPNQYFTGASGSQSPLFNVQMPSDNLFGGTEESVPELLLSPSAEQGYYLFVHPLAPGKHTIQWTASGCATDQAINITYHLIVTP